MKFLLAVLAVTTRPCLSLYIQPYGETFQPKPFQYEYGLSGDTSLPSFSKKEKQDSAGNVEGEYSVGLPDGRVMIVTYNADHYEGFVSSVDFRGEAAYPAYTEKAKTQNRYQNKPVSPFQATKPTLKFREIILPKLVPNSVKPTPFKAINSFKKVKSQTRVPVYSPTPVFGTKALRPKKQRKEVYLPTFYRPETNSFNPITENNEEETDKGDGDPTEVLFLGNKLKRFIPTISERSLNPTEVLFLGNKLKRFIPKISERSLNIEPKENIEKNKEGDSNKENEEGDSETIQKSKMFEIMKERTKITRK